MPHFILKEPPSHPPAEDISHMTVSVVADLPALRMDAQPEFRQGPPFMSNFTLCTLYKVVVVRWGQ